MHKGYIFSLFAIQEPFEEKFSKGVRIRKFRELKILVEIVKQLEEDVVEFLNLTLKLGWSPLLLRCWSRFIILSLKIKEAERLSVFKKKL